MSAEAAELAGENLENYARQAIAAFGRGAWQEAVVDLDKLLVERPRDIGLLNYKARALDQLERPQQALEAIDAALAVDPDNLIDVRNRGLLLRKLGRASEALVCFERVLAQRPADLDLLVKRIHLLNEQDRRHEALAEADRVLGLYPGNLMVLNARGSALESLCRYDEARATFEQMLGIDPTHMDALNNVAMVKARQGRWAEALQLYNRSLELHKEQKQAYYNRSIVRLALGDWAQGLEEFECRWELPPLKLAKPALGAPPWTGQPLTGKTLFVYHEQGYGDTLQFARYIPQIIAMGATVVLGVPPALAPLMRSLEGGPLVVDSGAKVPPHHFQCALMSVLKVLGISKESIAPVDRYLRADRDLSAMWTGRLGPKRRLRVGLVWRGRAYAPINYPRDVPLADLSPILNQDADFLALQTDIGTSDRGLAERWPNLDISHGLLLKDFSETAALVDTLDLVISADTAVAHLAGALGKPVWLLNRLASCWRWGQTGTTILWYPSMRIFRQKTCNDWSHVMREAGDALATEINRQATHSVQPPPPVQLQASATATGLRGIATSKYKRAKREKIRLVCATRGSTDAFLKESPLGRSLAHYRTFPRGQQIEVRLFRNNVEGLPTVYNIAIEEARHDPATLVFAHDDLYLSDYYWTEHLAVGLQTFDIVGIAGNVRRVPCQASWMYLNDRFESDSYENFSGVLGHGNSFPDLKQLSVYGDPGQPCKLLDGVFLAASSKTLTTTRLSFDTRFAFDFYDLDFCRQAELKDLSMGTCAMSLIHASVGRLGTSRWRHAYDVYLEKYGERS